MHFTEPVYRNPYWPTFPLLEITQGCTHNSCKFCTMYRDVRFKASPMEWVEEDLQEIASLEQHAKTLQLLSGNPLALSFNRLKERLELVNKYLPELDVIYTQARVSDIKTKSVEQLKELKEMGIREISLGVESGDDWTLQRVNKGYKAKDIIEQCRKIEEAGIRYWVTFLNGVAGKEHSREHAIHTAEIFNQLNPMLVGTGGLTLFPETPLLLEAQQGLFQPLTEEEMLIELRTFVEHLNVDCYFMTHHTSGASLAGPDFLHRKKDIIFKLDNIIRHGDLFSMARIRSSKRTL